MDSPSFVRIRAASDDWMGRRGWQLVHTCDRNGSDTGADDGVASENGI